jgi:hypothetical protein
MLQEERRVIARNASRDLTLARYLLMHNTAYAAMFVYTYNPLAGGGTYIVR